MARRVKKLKLSGKSADKYSMRRFFVYIMFLLVVAGCTGEVNTNSIVRPATRTDRTASIVRMLDEQYPQVRDCYIERVAISINKASIKYRISPELITAVIMTESSLMRMTRSRYGAIGLMQVLPATGKAICDEMGIEWRGKRMLYEIDHNINIGTRYLRKLIDRYDRVDTALTAYNAGPTRVDRYLKKGKRYSDTYANKVLRTKRKLLTVSL